MYPTDTVTITSKDARWVGAWWLGFLVSAGIMLLAGIPFWFLPRSMPKQGELPENPYELGPPLPTAEERKLSAIAKGKATVK